MTNLITLDGMSHFPKEFLDLKAFHSNKAQAICDVESSQDDVEQTAQERREASMNNRASNAAGNNILIPAADSRLVNDDNTDNRLLNSRPTNIRQ